MKKPEFIACLRDAPDESLQFVYDRYIRALNELFLFYVRLTKYQFDHVVNIREVSLCSASVVDLLREYPNVKKLLLEIPDSEVDNAYFLYHRTKKAFHKSKDFDVAVISLLNTKVVWKVDINIELVKYYVLEL